METNEDRHVDKWIWNMCDKEVEEGLKHRVPYQGNKSPCVKGLLDVGTTLLE